MQNNEIRLAGRVDALEKKNSELESKIEGLEKAVCTLISERDTARRDLERLISLSDEWACRYCAKRDWKSTDCGFNDGKCVPVWRGYGAEK